MGKVTLITGCPMSGKSRWAASYFESCDNVQYLCTASDIDSHTRSRIIYNESRHGMMWNIVKGFRFGGEVSISGSKFFILDSIDGLVRLQFYENPKLFGLSGEEKVGELTENVLEKLSEFVSAVKDAGGNLIIVTAEAAMVGEQSEYDGDYRLVLAIINERMSALADEVFFSASGIQFKIK